MRVKGTGNEEITNEDRYLSDRVHIAAAAAPAAAAPPASLQVALPCQQSVLAASFHFRSED